MCDSRFPSLSLAFYIRLRRHLLFGLSWDIIARFTILTFFFGWESFGNSFERHHEIHSQLLKLFLLTFLNNLLGKTILSDSTSRFISVYNLRTNSKASWLTFLSSFFILCSLSNYLGPFFSFSHFPSFTFFAFILPIYASLAIIFCLDLIKTLISTFLLPDSTSFRSPSCSASHLIRWLLIFIAR